MIDALKIKRLVVKTCEKQREKMLCRDDAFSEAANELGINYKEEEYLLAWEKFQEYKDFYL